MEKVMYELLLQALFNKRVPELGDEFYVAAKKMGYIEYSEFDKNNPELTEKGKSKLSDLKERFNPKKKPPSSSGGYEVEIKI